MSERDIYEYESVQKALARLKELTQKQVTVLHMREWQRQKDDEPVILPSPLCYAMPDQYRIYVGDEMPEQMAIHELLHAILIEEKYPNLKFDDGAALRSSQHREQFKQMLDAFANKVIHFEIYRRMVDQYGLEMRPYQELVAFELLAKAKTQSNNGEFATPLQLQVQNLNLWDIWWLGEPAKLAIEFYRSRAPNVFTTVSRIVERNKLVGMETPALAKIAGENLISEIIKHGERMGDDANNDLWRALYWDN